MTDLIESNKRGALSGWPMIIFWVAMLIFTGHSITRMVGAGDTWVAMACGRHFINNGVDTVEPFSANSHKAGPTEEELKDYPEWLHGAIKKWHPTGWVNQNWLTHVIFYWITHKSPIADAGKYSEVPSISGDNLSYNSLVYWKFAIYLITIIVVYYTARVLKVNPALSAVFACGALYVGRTFLDIRPAGFSNMLVAIYLFILVLTVYRNRWFIWLLVPVQIFWCNVHGGYIYTYITLVPFISLGLLTMASKKYFVSMSLRTWLHVIGASAAAFIGSIVFNPFHLTNLTHTFVVSVSKHAELWRTVNEWHPAFEWTNPVGVEQPFLVMYILSWVVLVFWVATMFLRPANVDKVDRSKENQKYEWPKIDLMLIAIAALTIYMAIRSRRFIPIAAIVACPVMAMFIDQGIRMISAVVNFKKQDQLRVSAMPKSIQYVLITAATIGTVFFGVFWGIKFHRVYLGPWPDSHDRTSIFMRMSASHAKPFAALDFIRENEFEGKMFNYWTEGGFIAYGQTPDPETGKTPLQLFMDGRAQAAYNTDAYQHWMYIISGGDIARRAKMANRPLIHNDYLEIGKWLEKKFKAEEVWVVLMPANQFNGTLLRSLETNSKWRPIFVNDKQKVIIDITSPQGKKVFGSLFNEQLKFPDDYSKHVTKAYNLLALSELKAQDLGFIETKKAFAIHQSHASASMLTRSYQYKRFREEIVQIATEYFNDFKNNKSVYRKQDGYNQKIVAAIVISNFMANLNRQDKEKEQYYRDVMKEYGLEQRQVSQNARW